MLTKTGAEFWVIMNDHTPAFPGPSRLPFLIEDPQSKDIRFEITHPFDERLKTYQSAVSAQSDIERLRQYSDLVKFLKNAYPFKVECTVRIASAGEAGGYFKNLPPTEPACAIPKVSELPTFKKVIVKYYGRNGFLTKEKRTIDKFVPWTVTSGEKVNCPGLIRRLIFFGSDSEFQQRWSSDGGAQGVLGNSYFTTEGEYHRLRLIYRKFQQHPEKFIAKDTTHDNL